MDYSDRANSTYIGTIVDVQTAPSAIASSVGEVLEDLGLLGAPIKAIAGENASAAKSLVIDGDKLRSMQHTPLLIANAHATNVISLLPCGKTAGNEAAFVLQQVFKMKETGDTVFLKLAQQGTPGIISLAGSSLTAVTAATDGLSLIKVVAGVVGTASDSTVTIKSLRVSDLFA